ncbi:MAG: YqeG family HAD IIIA-type phosphatase [Clostridia bacterium]|nr:YqeG family HAD IIIA-type phosphatase [Clostridia bacterium]
MLLRPDIKKNRITDLTPELLHRFGVRGLILDVDNTLSTHHGEQLIEGLEEWLTQMRREGFRMVVLSNSVEKRVKPFAEKIGLDYLAAGVKPLPFKYFSAIRKLGVGRRETAAIGDQIFTDVLGGNAVGVTTVLLTPILPEQQWRFRFKRYLERKIIGWYHIKETEG